MKQINNLFINNKLNIKSLLILFIIIQPIFDLKIFYNSISTLVRVIFISLFFLYYFKKSSNRKKYFLLIYPLLIIIYFIFHHINALSFHSLVPGDFNYSPISEALYFIKMICPFMLTYSLYKGNLSKNEILFIIKAIVLFMSIIIIFSNLFLFSYGSYSDTKIKANFFEWFNLKSTYTYQDLASKGLFEFANQISAILLMFLPFIIYMNLEIKDKLNIAILCLNVFALILLCTKVAVLGVILVFIYTLFIYLIKNHRIKNMSVISLIFLIYILLLPFNPSLSRMFERKEIIETASLAIVDVPNDNVETTIENYSVSPAIQFQNEVTNNFKLNYIETNYQKQKINENFILNRYPYTYDSDFWYTILTNDYENKSDYRYLEKSMVKRVIEINNNNRFDKFLGITYTRIQNIFNIEKDFVMQYYSLGIIGLVLFISPYFIILCYFFIKHLRSKFKYLQEHTIIVTITMFMIFAISYYSGNLLNSLSFTIYLAFFANILLLSNTKKVD